LQGEIQEYHRGQLEKDGIFLPPREETVLTISGNFTQKELDKAAKKGDKKQSNIAAPMIENPLPDETLSDAIASTKKQKSTRRSVKTKAKYTRDELEKLKIDELRKAYRAAVPHSDRNSEKHSKAEYATKEFMIDAILTAKTLTTKL